MAAVGLVLGLWALALAAVLLRGAGGQDVHRALDSAERVASTPELIPPTPAPWQHVVAGEAGEVTAAPMAAVAPESVVAQEVVAEEQPARPRLRVVGSEKSEPAA